MGEANRVLQGLSARETCPNDILTALLDKPLGFEDLVKSVNYSRGTVSKYLNELFEEFVTRNGRGGPYCLTQKGKKRAIMLKNENQFRNLSIGEQQRLLRELEGYKRRERISEFEDRPLPGRAVLKKLLELNFKIENFYNKDQLQDDSCRLFSLTSKHGEYPEKFCNNAVYFSNHPDAELAEDIEIKLIPFKGPRQSGEIVIEYGPEWKILVDEPIRGKRIIGAYKELLKLNDEEFNYQWLKWKEDFSLTDEDWKTIGPKIHNLMKEGFWWREIEFTIKQYLDSKKEN